jgi:DNA-binding protein H-NS
MPIGEDTMAKLDIKAMDIDGLLALRREIDARLSDERKQLETRFALLSAESPVRGNGRIGRRGKSLKGRKIAPKYRSRKDRTLTWAGRGATPRWMRVEMKAGKLKKEAFLIK